MFIINKPAARGQGKNMEKEKRAKQDIREVEWKYVRQKDLTETSMIERKIYTVYGCSKHL